MAQKLGLALVALFGLVQCEISILRSAPYGLINLAPAGSHSHQIDSGDEEEGHGPRLGENDPHLGLSIVNFSTKTNDLNLYDSFGQIVKPNDNSDRRRSSSNDRSDSSGKRGERFGERREAARSGSKGKSDDWKGYERRGNSPKKAEDDRVPVRVVVTQAVRTINLESDSHHESHSEDHDEHPPKKVAVPIFTNLHYVDTDSHGQATKAPITVVTAPLVSTAEIDRHKVPINQNLGKSNCPECIEEDKEAARTKKAADKALQRDDNLLKTKIEAPIKEVYVAVGEHHSSATRGGRHQSRGGERRSGLHKHVSENGHSESKTECESSEAGSHEDNSHHQEDSHEPRYSGKNLDQSAVNRALALGQARENSPFVVKSVVIPAQGNLKYDHDDDHSERRHN